MKKIWYSISVVIVVVICLFCVTYNNNEKRMLQDIISYKVMDSDVYTPSSYSQYIDALNEAIAINDKYFSSKEDINVAIYNLQNKIDNLYIKPDKTILQNKYEDAIKTDLDLYLPNSTLDLKEAIIKAYSVINDDNTIIEDVDGAINMLDEAFNVLVIKPDKTILNDLIIKALAVDKDTYTTVTYDILRDSVKNAYTVINDVNATQKEVDDAVELINDGLDNLVVAQKGIYKITYSAYMLSNNHVGNEWGYMIFHNSNKFKNGDLVTANIDSNIMLSAEVYEYDKVMDYGTSSVNLILKDGYEATTEVIVRENRGRYYGNIATFEIECYVELVEIIA